MIDSLPTSSAPASDVTPASEPKRRGLLWVFLFLVLLGCGGGGWLYLNPAQADDDSAAKHGRAHDTATPVETATAQKGILNITLDALGTVTPLADVTVKPQISGQLMELGFQEGQMVHAGDFLAQIDPRLYENALHQAEGNFAKDSAQLQQAETVLARDTKLIAVHALSQQDFDAQKAAVDQFKAAVQVDQAAIDTAKLNLVYCHITAPVAGRVGLRQVDIGNYVQMSDTDGIVKITQLQPISVLFSIPEDRLPQIMERLKNGDTITVQAMDRSQSKVLASGKLGAVDNAINASTGTVKMRALFDNEDLSLYPNQFVNIRILVQTFADALLVPSAALQRGANGSFVYLVTDEQKATIRPVTPGPAEGDKVSITEGLKENDHVIVDGTDKLSEGSKVKATGTNAAP